MNQERQKLDLEDEEARRERLGKLFLNISKSDLENDSSSTPLDINNLNRARPHAIPESDVLARVKAFLPQFQQSTTALLQQASIDPNAVNLENVNKGERMVAMDLGLGVYDAPGLSGTEGMEGRGFGPVVESDPSGLDGMDQDDDEDDEEEDEEEDEEDEDNEDNEDTSDSTSSGSSDDDEEEEEEEEDNATTTASPK